MALSGSTINICPDGLLAESSQDIVTSTGELFIIELEVPDADSTNQFSGKVSAYARVIRTVDSEQKTGRKQIAFQFCTRPQFDM